MTRRSIAAVFAVFIAVMTATLAGLQFARRRLARSAVRLVRPEPQTPPAELSAVSKEESGEPAVAYGIEELDEDAEPDSELEDFGTFRTLDEARAMDHTAVILQGGGGAQIYLTVPVEYVRCDEAALRELLATIDRLGCNRPSEAELSFELAPIGSGVFGGLGGGSVVDGVWVHPNLEAEVAPLTRDVILGRIPAADLRAYGPDR